MSKKNLSVFFFMTFFCVSAVMGSDDDVSFDQEQKTKKDGTCGGERYKKRFKQYGNRQQHWWQQGMSTGVRAGWNAATQQDFQAARARGFQAGRQDGFQETAAKLGKEAFTAGHKEGFEAGRNTSVKDAFQAGLQVGSQESYWPGVFQGGMFGAFVGAIAAATAFWWLQQPTGTFQLPWGRRSITGR